MTGIIETTAAVLADIDGVFADGQGNGTITAARVRQAIENLIVSLSPPETALAFASPMTWTLDTSPVAVVTVTGNTTLTIAGGVSGASYRLAIIQGGTGSNVVALAGVTIDNTPVWKTAIGGVNILNVDMIAGAAHGTVI